MSFGYFLTSSFSRSAAIGGFVGLISSGASNVKKYKEGDTNPSDAGIEVGKDAVGTGIATGLATAASGILGHSFLLMAGTSLAVGIAAKYVWNEGMKRLDEKNAAGTA
jgi:hypothetical protein